MSGKLTYESVGHSRIAVGVTSDGVSIVANRDGLESLIRLLRELRDGPGSDHMHLTPSMQLTEDSAVLVIGRRDE